MNSKQQSYSIGLDIGVASVGWSCLTSDFRIPKFNGRHAIGVREFESAQTAENHRIQRGTRRRYNRRLRRIQLLQQIIDPLFKNDPEFLILNSKESKHFWRHSNKFENNSLSETLKYLDENPRKYPTIYHLRHALVEQDKQFHPRLIYLALHNLIKYRGHFLNENLTWTSSGSDSLEHILEEFFEQTLSEFFEFDHLSADEYEQIVKILQSTHLTDSDKRRDILKITGRNLRQPISLILGLSTNFALMFPFSENVSSYKEEKLKIAFNKDEIDEIIDKLTDQERELVNQGYVIYQNILLNDLLGQSGYVSEAKVLEYEQFGQDLKALKEIYNKHLGEQAYREMFITSRTNWTTYEKTRQDNLLSTFDQFLRVHKTVEKFYRDIKRSLNQLINQRNISEKEKEKIHAIINKIDNNNFLQKQRSYLNSAIPHQNNVYEAETILKNQQKYYPEITDDMISKIKQIIKFRIPYYIGPLIKQQEQSKFGWVERKKDGRVKPWTIDKIIDRSASAEAFINRMTSYCAYLNDEKVLPKYSLVYQKFELLNELNGVQLRLTDQLPNKDHRLDQDVKKWIIENVFMKYKNVTHNRLIQELKKSEYKHVLFENGRLKQIFGTQQENRFSTSLSTFIDMKQIFGEITANHQEMIEELIYWITVFEDKDIIEFKIKEKYPEITTKQLRRLINLPYTGWGRLSKKLLDELPADRQENKTILDIMNDEPIVFMEVLSIEKYDLENRITKINQKDEDKYKKIKYQDVMELHGSPALKKGIWQSILIIEELVDIFGEPEHIMIEFAREDGIKRRTDSRKKRINDLQRAIDNDEVELKKFLQKHSTYEETQYRDNRLYLYITQKGKCLYSGKTLDISRLQDYEIDHILPRNFVKDDSIDNLALVLKEMNQAKGADKMPLEIIQDKYKQKMYWKSLLDHKLISQTKYFRLMKESFTGQDKESFFARQLVETRQITKHVKDLLNERFEHTEVHPVNANIVSNLRKTSKVMKVRNLNNKHHAVDALMANLIVQYILKRYGANFLNFNFKYQEARKKWRKMLSDYRKNFFLFDDMINDQTFTHYETGEIINGYQFLHMINDEIPWRTTKKIGSSEAAFYNETIYSPKSTKGRNPQYQSTKLSKGVHSNLNIDSSYLISYKYLNNKGKEVTNSMVVNYFVIEKYQNKKMTQKELALFLANKVAKGKVIDAVIHTKILKHQLLLVEDYPLYFISSQERGEMNNARQFKLDKDTSHKLYKVLDKINRKKSVPLNVLRNTFSQIALEAIRQYKSILPESRIKNIEEYAEKIDSVETFEKGLSELFAMAGAGASRSAIFGGRILRRLDPKKTKFIYQSITGLRFRRPKSYHHELWLK